MSRINTIQKPGCLEVGAIAKTPSTLLFTPRTPHFPSTRNNPPASRHHRRVIVGLSCAFHSLSRTARHVHSPRWLCGFNERLETPPDVAFHTLSLKPHLVLPTPVILVVITGAGRRLFGDSSLDIGKLFQRQQSAAWRGLVASD
jgi:hypothetical protein